MNDIKIPYKLFVELYKCHCLDDYPVSDKIYIQNALQAKFEALKRHTDYNKPVTYYTADEPDTERSGVIRFDAQARMYIHSSDGIDYYPTESDKIITEK